MPIIDLYITNLNELVDLPEKLSIYVFEKPSVNVTPGVTKDGIHIIFGIRIQDNLKVTLRNRILTGIENAVSEDDGFVVGFVYKWHAHMCR